MPFRTNVSDKEQHDLERAADDSAIRIHHFDGKEAQEGETKSIRAYDGQESQDQAAPVSSGSLQFDNPQRQSGGVVGQHNDKPARFESDQVGRPG